MDFKARHPHLDYFPYETRETASMVFPYDDPTRLCILEYDAPDDSTQFLALPYHMTDDEEHLVTYFIEAPVNCPMRKAFEYGELTWFEYWYHKGWLLEVKIEFQTTNGTCVRYIDPKNMVSQKKEYLERVNDISPMEYKLIALEGRLASAQRWGESTALPQQQLDEFRRNYPMIQRINKKTSKVA